GPYPTPDNTGYLFNPSTHSWNAFPSLVYATRNYGYTELDGFLYAMGGYDYSGSLPAGANFSQRYDASAPAGSPTPTSTGTLPTRPPHASPRTAKQYAPIPPNRLRD